jgi:leucyl aminopeptidase
MQITFKQVRLPVKGVLLIPFFENGDFLPNKKIQETDGDFFTNALKTVDMKKKKDDFITLGFLPFRPSVKTVAVRFGDSLKIDAARLQILGGKIADFLMKDKTTKASLFMDILPKKTGLPADEAACQIAFGAAMNAYRFTKYKTRDDEKEEEEICFDILTPMATQAKDLFSEFQNLLYGIYTARDLVSEPANALTPDIFAQKLCSLKIENLKVTVFDEKQIAEKGLNLITAVGKGAINPPRLAVLEYNGLPEKDSSPVLFVGKGVCFDAGGISLKPALHLADMKYDMAGAAAVTGALIALSLNKEPVHVVGIMPLVENMPSGSAVHPGDVIKSLSGLTVEVDNTDAEGRLILADALWFGQETFKPEAVVDLATLTGAMKYALGGEYAGLFSNHERLQKELITAGQHTTHDRLWPFPMDAAYEKLIASDIADIRNIGTKPEAGSITAALFLKRFIQKGVKWAHLDIAGTAWATESTPVCPKGATGFGVQLLTVFALEHKQTNRRGRRRPQ